MKRMDRLYPRPLPSPACIYSGYGEYPERLKASFQDGHVKTYWMEVEQPAPHIRTEKDMEKQYWENGGYKFRKRPVKRRLQTFLQLASAKRREATEHFLLEEINRMQGEIDRLRWKLYQIQGGGEE